MLTIIPEKTTTAKLHGFLLSAVAPRPIALASTIDAEGNPNLSPFSFFNVFSAKPPIMIFSPARRVRDNTTKHTLENVLAVPEVVINVVTHAIVQQTSLASTEYGQGVNEFVKSGLTMQASDSIRPYRVAESPIQFECLVKEVKALGDEGGAGNLVICEVQRMHLGEEILDAEGNIDQIQLDLVARAGGSYYSRLKDAVFEIPKPIRSKGIGVDALPKAVRLSSVLTGNDLGVLGNVEALPTQADVDKFLQENPDLLGMELNEKHTFAKRLLQDNKAWSAWMALLS